jgi:hypothetical protein
MRKKARLMSPASGSSFSKLTWSVVDIWTCTTSLLLPTTVLEVKGEPDTGRGSVMKISEVARSVSWRQT